MKKYFFFTIVSFVVLSSCSKQTETQDNNSGSLTDFNFSFQQTDLDYVKIPEGTYFLYRDSASNSIDSVIVSSSLLKYYITPESQPISPSCLNCIGAPAFSSLGFILEMIKYDGLNKIEWFKGTANITNPGFSNNGVNNSLLPLVLRETTTSLNSIGLNGGVAYNIQATALMIPKINVEGTDYLDVVMFNDKNTTNTLSQYYAASTYYWAKGIGIIKRSITKGQITHTWTLLKRG